MKFFLFFLLIPFSMGVQAQDKDPKVIIQEAVSAVGGLEALHQKKDVTYRYIYGDTAKGIVDVSTEKYIFDGELSWAEYHKSDSTMKVPGSLIQSYDGKESWYKLDGKLNGGPEQLGKMADFLRKTNYYWFAMMFKLNDPGTTLAYEGQRVVEGIPYDMVRLGFEGGIGDVQDTYLLYVNPYTKLVDQFLFTVLDFGRQEPLLMKVQYQDVEGLLIPVVRRYAPADWDGNVAKDAEWVMEVSEDIRFNTGLKRSDFSKPAQ